MGKRLIVKNADFSENGIYNALKLTSYLKPLVVGACWAASGRGVPVKQGKDTKRASTEEIIDITNIAPSLGVINLTAKDGYRFACYFGNNVAGDNLIPWAYTNSGDTLTVDISNCTRAVIMVAANDNSVLVSSDWDTYLTES